MDDGIRWEAIPDYGHKMTVEEFANHCRSGSFIDYDGFGNYAMEDKMCDLIVKPSDYPFLDKRFTHVIWYNR